MYKIRIVTLKNGEISNLPELLGECPIKFLIISESIEKYDVVPMFFGFPENTESFNDQTIIMPFKFINTLPEEIRYLSIQPNKMFCVLKIFVEKIECYEINIAEKRIMDIYPDYEWIDASNAPEIVDSIEEYFFETVAINEREELSSQKRFSMASLMKRFAEEIRTLSQNVYGCLCLPQAASGSDSRQSVIINTTINNLSVYGGIEVRVSDNTFEPVIDIYLECAFKDTVWIYMKLIIDKIETVNFELGCVSEGVVEKRLTVSEIPHLKIDSEISSYVIGFK